MKTVAKFSSVAVSLNFLSKSPGVMPGPESNFNLSFADITV